MQENLINKKEKNISDYINRIKSQERLAMPDNTSQIRERKLNANELKRNEETELIEEQLKNLNDTEHKWSKLLLEVTMTSL